MNNIANVFIEAYEDDIEVTPEMLIDAGWSYEQLAQFMRCCNILRSISTFHEEHLASSYHEKVKQVCMSALEEVSDLLSDLIGVRVEWDLLSCSVLYGRHFQKLFYKDYFANDLDWFSIIDYDLGTIQTVIYLIGKYFVENNMVSLTDGFQCELNEKICRLTLEKAKYRKYELDAGLERLKKRQTQMEIYDPYFEIDDDEYGEYFSDFESIYKWIAKISKRSSEMDEIANEIYKTEEELEELNLNLKSPSEYRFLYLSQENQKIKWTLQLENTNLVPSSALMLVGLQTKHDAQEIIIVDDVKDHSDKNIWVNRSLSHAIFSTLMQGKQTFKFKEIDYTIESVTILSDKAMDILCDVTFRDQNNIKTVYVYSQKDVDHIEHNCESVTAYVMCANSTTPIPFNIYYNGTSDMYFINRASYLGYAARYGLPMMKLKPYTRTPGTFSRESLSEMSVLRLYGYTVNETDDLTDGERQELLINLIDSGFMDKVYIINHIEWLIHTHEGNIQYMNACDKWQTDLDFVNSYNIDSQRAIWGRFVHHC